MSTKNQKITMGQGTKNKKPNPQTHVQKIQADGMEQRSSKTCLMLGLSCTGRIHLRDVASSWSISLEDSSPPAMSLSIQSITLPSLSHSLTQSVRSTAPDCPDIMSPALFLVNNSIRITPSA